MTIGFGRGGINSKFNIGEVVIAIRTQYYSTYKSRISRGYIGTVTNVGCYGLIAVDGKVNSLGNAVMCESAFELYNIDEAGNLKEELNTLKMSKILDDNIDLIY